MNLEGSAFECLESALGANHQHDSTVALSIALAGFSGVPALALWLTTHIGPLTKCQDWSREHLLATTIVSGLLWWAMWYLILHIAGKECHHKTRTAETS